MCGCSRVLPVVALVVMLSASPVAWAQDAPRTPAAERSGFVIGFSLGGGAASCGSCDTRAAGAVGLHVGGMLTRRLALLFDSGLVAFTDGPHEYQHTVGGLAAQYFLGRRYWLKGGVGVAQFSVNNYLGPRRLGAFVGAGAELVQRGRFALDVSGRLAVGRHPGGAIRNTTVQLGFTWY